jgi:hypothetical protein
MIGRLDVEEGKVLGGVTRTATEKNKYWSRDTVVPLSSTFDMILGNT